MKKRILAMALALVLVACAAVAGTVAWLSANTGPVTNTFVVGDINIDLKEHNLLADGNLDQNNEVNSEDTYKILPGAEQPKDPFVRVEANSEDCWVFMTVKEEYNDVTTNIEGVTKYVEYTVDTNVWAALMDGTTHVEYSGAKVYYTTYTGDAKQEYNILTNEKVTYNQKLTKDDIDALGENQPKLIFMAYAIQSEGLKDATNADVTTALAAWNLITTP